MRQPGVRERRDVSVGAWGFAPSRPRRFPGQPAWIPPATRRSGPPAAGSRRFADLVTVGRGNWAAVAFSLRLLWRGGGTGIYCNRHPAPGTRRSSRR
jgi:hypothetical protein